MQDNPFLNKETSKQPEFIHEPVDGSFTISISYDKMSASVSIVPPKHDGKPAAMEKILESIKAEGITAQIDEAKIKSAIEEASALNMTVKNVVFAIGVPPTSGKDGYVKYNVVIPDLDAKPQLDPIDAPELSEEELKSNVDFKELNLIANVKKGDVIAEKVPPEDGKDGIGVTGEPVKPLMNRSTDILPGIGVLLSEDGKAFISDLDGHVVIKGKYINVEPVYNVRENVDYSTGNIHFKGSVVIGGTVLEGFVVEAGGSIGVKKLVEGGTLISGGDINVEGGIIGNEKSKIVCGGTLRTTYIENGTIEAKNDVIVTKVILNSNVMANGKVLIEKGSIVGGVVNSALGITARIIGSDFAQTKVVAGADVEIQRRLKAIQTETLKIQGNLDKIQATLGPIIKDPKLIGIYPKDKQDLIKKLIGELKNQQVALSALHEEKEKIHKEASMLKTALIIATGEIKPDVKVTIGSCSFENQRLIKSIQLWENRTKNAIEMGPVRKGR